MLRPNILFFIADDHQANAIAAIGNPAVRTPNLDQLAARGVSCQQAYVMGSTATAVCMPSRAMLMTGRELFHIDKEGQSIPETHTMLGEAFAQEGYKTFGSGKWHNGSNCFNRCFSHGAEIFFGGMIDQWNVPVCDYDTSGRYQGKLPICTDPWHSNKLLWRQGDHVMAGQHSSEVFANATISFIEQQDNQTPFLAYTAFTSPHDPRNAPPEYHELYNPEAIEIPPNFTDRHPFDNGELSVRDEQLESWPRTPNAIRRQMADYYAMITHMDAQIGRILETLKKKGLADNTIVIFTSDHGLSLGQHGLMGKQNLYEHSIRVPLLIAGPGIPANEICQSPCYLLDVFPTLCEICNVSIPTSCEGLSLLSQLCGKHEPARDMLYFAYRDVQRAVRQGDYKLIEYAVDGSCTTQLFNLRDDPWEITNLVNRQSEQSRIYQLRHLLLDERNKHSDFRSSENAFWQTYLQSHP
jgi:arylsulfatase A-like enzyme